MFRDAFLLLGLFMAWTSKWKINWNLNGKFIVEVYPVVWVTWITHVQDDLLVIILLRSIMLWAYLVRHYWEGDLDRLPIRFFQHLVPRLPVVLQLLIRLRLCWDSGAAGSWGNVAPCLLLTINNSTLRKLSQAHPKIS